MSVLTAVIQILATAMSLFAAAWIASALALRGIPRMNLYQAGALSTLAYGTALVVQRIMPAKAKAALAGAAYGATAAAAVTP